MHRITLDEALLEQIRDLNEPTELCDPSGRVVGKFVPNFDPQEWELLGPDLAAEQPPADEHAEEPPNGEALPAQLEDVQPADFDPRR
jgi:hypothetical protein